MLLHPQNLGLMMEMGLTGHCVAAGHSPESCIRLVWRFIQLSLGHWRPYGIVGDRATDSLVGVKKDLLGKTPASFLMMLLCWLIFLPMVLVWWKKERRGSKVTSRTFTVRPLGSLWSAIVMLSSHLTSFI